MLVMKNDKKPTQALTASSLKAGQLFILATEELEPENVKMAVCYYGEDDNDVKLIYPFNKLCRLDTSDELKYIGENVEVIPVAVMVEEIVKA